jgi:hypothetical protein
MPRSKADKVIVAVYDPPRLGLPHLVVIIDESGDVSAVGFETAKEADAYAEETVGAIVAVVTGNEAS